MAERPLHDPQIFIEVLREFQVTPAARRGELANAMSEAIITKRVDLAAVRQALLDTADDGLLQTLDDLIDLIEPYIEEGGVEE